jgi:RNA-directed DNA polymerase
MCKAAFITGDTMEVDHIIPKSKGGKDEYSNLQLLHRQCHVEKTKKDLQL